MKTDSAPSVYPKHLLDCDTAADYRQLRQAGQVRQANEGHEDSEHFESPAQAAPSFLPAPRFAGVRQGYVFTTGQQGLGYYRDSDTFSRNSLPEHEGADAARLSRGASGSTFSLARALISSSRRLAGGGQTEFLGYRQLPETGCSESASLFEDRWPSGLIPDKVPENSTESFVRAPRFSGPRPGYVFTSGQHGVGYYLDPRDRLAQS